MRPETFKTETCKNGLETKSQDFITANNPTKLSNLKVVKYLFMVRQLCGCPYPWHAWYKAFNSNAILPNINLW